MPLTPVLSNDAVLVSATIERSESDWLLGQRTIH